MAEVFRHIARAKAPQLVQCLIAARGERYPNHPAISRITVPFDQAALNGAINECRTAALRQVQARRNVRHALGTAAIEQTQETHLHQRNRRSTLFEIDRHAAE